MTGEIYENRRLEAQDFIAKLTQLRDDNDRREMASLKRNAGNMLSEARGVGWFYRLLDADGRQNSDIYFLVATLWALDPRGAKGNFGHTCHEFWKKKSPNHPEKEKVNSAIARRFNILLDADIAGGELAFRLRQFVKLLASQEIGIDWVQFVLDVRMWSYQGKHVQRDWAQSFYAPHFAEDTDVVMLSAEGAEKEKGESHVD